MECLSFGAIRIVALSFDGKEILSDREIIMGYLEGRKPEHGVVTGWIKEVVGARVWEPGISPQDVLADTAYKLLVNFQGNKFNFESSLKTYVQRIVMFTIVDSVRAHRRLKSHFGPAGSEISDDPNPHTLVEQGEESKIFQRVFALLDQKCRELWTMLLNESLNYKQIGERLNIGESTVKTRVLRCKEKAIEIRKSIT